MRYLTFLSVLIFAFLVSVANGQFVTIDGNCFLESAVSYDSIQVVFNRTAPYPLTDTVFTNPFGYYSVYIETGIYNIYYSKHNWMPDSLLSRAFYSSSTLPDMTLDFSGLTGYISGILPTGTYEVRESIMIALGETLIIEPGTRILFGENSSLSGRGHLIAQGTETDSIYFSSISDTTRWYGMGAGTLSFALAYSVIEKTSTGLVESGGGEAVHCSFRDNFYVMHSYNSFKFLSCEFTGNSAECLFATHYGELVFENCLFSQNVERIFSDYGSPYLFVKNSTFVSNRGSISNGNGIFINSIFAFNEYGFGGVDFNYFSIWHCAFWNNGPSFLPTGDFPFLGVNVTVNANGDSCDPYNNISKDPLFADTSLGNFHILAGSPCIDAGAESVFIGALDTLDTLETFIFAPNTDFDGEIRPFGGGYDIGADEYYPTIVQEIGTRPEKFSLSVFPNPFNSSVRIRSQKSEDRIQNVEIYDIAGKKVFEAPVGEHLRVLPNDGKTHRSSPTETIWSPAPSVPSGVYLVRAKMGDREITRKAVYLK